jgi:hypothetical protein
MAERISNARVRIINPKARLSISRRPSPTRAALNAIRTTSRSLERSGVFAGDFNGRSVAFSDYGARTQTSHSPGVLRIIGIAFRDGC